MPHGRFTVWLLCGLRLNEAGAGPLSLTGLLVVNDEFYVLTRSPLSLHRGNSALKLCPGVFLGVPGVARASYQQVQAVWESTLVGSRQVRHFCSPIQIIVINPVKLFC